MTRIESETTEIYLKPFTLEECLQSIEYTHTEAYLKYDDPTHPVPTEEELIRFWCDQVETGKYVVMGIHLRTDDTLVGYVNAFDFNDETLSCESGINIFPPSNFGKGYGTAAYALFLPYLKEEKRMKQVKILTHPDNIPAQRLYRKIGFHDAGTEADTTITWTRMIYKL